MKHLDQKGMTMLELLISTIIIGILAYLVSGFYVDRLVEYSRNDAQIVLQGNTKQALESLARDVRAARTISVTNQWPDTHGPAGNPYGWTSNTGSPSTLVLAVPAVDTSGNLMYADASHSALQTNDVIYYIDSAKKLLYRRIVANPVSGNAARTTCPLGNVTPTCPHDGQVIEDVANMVVTYYDTNNTPTSNVNNVYSIGVTLTQSRASFGRTYTNSLSSRITLRNKP